MVIDKKKYIESLKRLHKVSGFKENIDDFINRYIKMQESRGNKFV